MPHEKDKPLGAFSDQRRYELYSKIAEGGMGSVYRANQLGVEQFRKDVALKMIRSHFSQNDEFVRLFISEAKLVADLVHENIVQVYHLGKADEQYFIAMEYVDGINLQDFMTTHQERALVLDPDLGGFIISRICRGLEYAHNKADRQGQALNIVHRDVSPRNIMINYEGVVKLTDFGIAKAARVMEQQEGSVLMGKVAYMSPEQARGEETDRRSDLFSLGVVMYEVLTGRHFVQDEDIRHSDIRRSLAKVSTAKIPDPKSIRSDLPDGLSAILMKALERDRKKRYQTAGEMGDALENYMYHDRYGPTNVTLGNYVKLVFLGIENPQPGLERKIMILNRTRKMDQDRTTMVSTTQLAASPKHKPSAE